MYCFPFLSPGNSSVHVHITLFAVNNSRVWVGAQHVNMDVRYPQKSGEVRFRGSKAPIDIPGDKIRSVDGNVFEVSAVPHDPSHFIPPDS